MIPDRSRYRLICRWMQPLPSGSLLIGQGCEEKVYNPFDILLLFRNRKFDAWWFETGTPAFLVETLFQRRVSSAALGEMMGTGDLLSAFDVDRIATEALLFQTGYLTIRDEEDIGGETFYPIFTVRRAKAPSLSGCESRPATVAPAGSSRSG